MLSTILAFVLYFLPAVTFSTSQKGKTVAVDRNNYRYCYKQSSSKCKTWRCSVRSCKAKIYTDVNNDELLGTLPDHEHGNHLLRNIAKEETKEVLYIYIHIFFLNQTV